MAAYTAGIYSSLNRGVTVGARTPVAYTAPCCCPACTGLQCLDRTRFFAGQLLSEADLNNEQSYWLAKSRLHNRYLNGWGVVCGMQVVCGECDGWVTIHSGYAIDPCGNDIIVCEDQNFNVAQAIQQCCTPATTKAPNCTPLRYNPSPTCKNSQQEWCITIEYQEQPSRLVTPLTPSNSQSSQACSCGCGCNSGSSSSKGKTNSANNLTATGSCKNTPPTKPAPPATTTVPAGTCEATRIVEGFTFGVVPASEVAAQLEAGNPNSLKAQMELCILELVGLISQAPNLSNYTNSQSAYQATCNYFAQVTQTLTGASNVTQCIILDRLSAIQITQGNEVGYYTGLVAEIKLIAIEAYLNCLCYSLIPPCPPPACDDRIVLACVTVVNGKVINICHYPGRKQLITLQTLGYWLGPLGLDNLGQMLGVFFSQLCCASTREYNANNGLANAAYYNESLKTSGVTSGADINRIATHFIAQNMGASVINAISPQARAVDLRPMVNQPAEKVKSQLLEQGFSSVTTQAVDEDPAWTADAVANSTQFAPAAVSAGQPLKVYTKGDVAVGFDVVDPTAAKLQDLQDQITALQSQLGTRKTANNPVPTRNNPK
jgi:hypothetical protein